MPRQVTGRTRMRGGIRIESAEGIPIFDLHTEYTSMVLLWAINGHSVIGYCSCVRGCRLRENGPVRLKARQVPAFSRPERYNSQTKRAGAAENMHIACYCWLWRLPGLRWRARQRIGQFFSGSFPGILDKNRAAQKSAAQPKKWAQLQVPRQIRDIDSFLQGGVSCVSCMAWVGR